MLGDCRRWKRAAAVGWRAVGRRGFLRAFAGSWNALSLAMKTLNRGWRAPFHAVGSFWRRALPGVRWRWRAESVRPGLIVAAIWLRRVYAAIIAGLWGLTLLWGAAFLMRRMWLRGDDPMRKFPSGLMKALIGAGCFLWMMETAVVRGGRNDDDNDGIENLGFGYSGEKNLFSGGSHLLRGAAYDASRGERLWQKHTLKLLSGWPCATSERGVLSGRFAEKVSAPRKGVRIGVGAAKFAPAAGFFGGEMVLLGCEDAPCRVSRRRDGKFPGSGGAARWMLWASPDCGTARSTALSGGEQQRVRLRGRLALRPKSSA